MQGDYDGLLTIKGGPRLPVKIRIVSDMICLTKVSAEGMAPKQTYVKLDGLGNACSDRDVINLIAGMEGPPAVIAQQWLKSIEVKDA